MTHTMHLDLRTPALAEVTGDGGQGQWLLAGAAGLVNNANAWRAVAEKVANEQGFEVIEWRDRPTGGHFALMRRADSSAVAEVRAALALIGYEVAEVTEENAQGLRVRLVRA
ncbi:hypothetical protein [Actinosynnema sp. NPDC020468]|uniref:hypothetical protein n=1 Tax=Actinosynnema sp. NPDC020468 TaxID=3154488 RepID=UPI0033FADBCA